MNVNRKRTLARFCSAIGGGAVLRALNSNRKKVLTFHNVLPDELFARYPANPVCDSESRFRTIIRLLKRRYRFSTDINDSETLTITFDDGYCNEGEVAGRVLQEEGDIPAIVFASGKALRANGMEDALVVDRLMYWCWYAPKDALEHLTGFRNSHDAWVKVIFPSFMKDGESRGENYFSKCDAIYPLTEIISKFDSEYRRLRFGGIPEAKLDELRSRGWIIGWHTESHFPLGALSESEIRKELTAPGAMAGLPMSYPYGHESQVGPVAVKVAEEFGYPVAYSDQMDACVLTGRWFAPRFEQFVTNEDGLEFELSGMKYFLKHHTRIPKI